MNKRKRVLLSLMGLAIFIGLGVFYVLFKNKKSTNFSERYNSYIMRMNNPTSEKAIDQIKKSLLNEFASCNCLPAGFPKSDDKGISLSDEQCDYIGVPGFQGNTTFGVFVYLLSNNMFSQVKNDTPSVFIGDITPGRFCFDSPFIGLNKKRREVIERAFSKIHIKGYEKYD